VPEPPPQLGRDDLVKCHASWLGVTTDQLAAMALVPTCQAHEAGRYGADPDRLDAVLSA
jgi:hypothetical protein